MHKTNSSFFENKKYVFVALILPALVLYLKSLRYDFTPMDEQWMILKNASFLQNWASIKLAFTSPIAELYYRPLFMVSLIVDYHLGKFSPFFYHFTNLVFHLGCVILAYNFFILSKVQKKLAFVFALLFSIHPIVLHAVAWVPGRNDVMLCFFTLLSLIYLQKFLLVNKIKFIFLHFLFFVCALFTKESAIVLPLIFGATYFTYTAFSFKKSWVLVLFWIVTCVLWFLIRNSVVNYMLPMETNFLSTIKNFVFAFILFIGKAIVPINQSVLPTLNNVNIAFGLIAIALFTFITYGHLYLLTKCCEMPTRLDF